jgi:redox-regulated HSP33 family molecular chaperone
MRHLLFTAILFVTTSAFGKDNVLKFNSALIDQIHTDVQKDDLNDNFKKRPAMRGPASVEEVTDSKEQETQKFEKSNIKQFGPNKW